jgi:DNA-binding GntR family transcriptional regulator
MPAAEALPYEFLNPLNLGGRGATTERVLAALRSAIVSLRLAPGEDLDKQSICDRLGVSRFPVSEALARLQAEGLVDILPQRGTRVTRIRIADINEATFIRRALEVETVRTLALRPADALIDALEANLRLQRVAAAAEDRDGFHSHDLAFHQILLDALAHRRARIAVEAARANIDRVRRLLSSPRRQAVSLSEHEAIVRAIASGDATAAATAMERHVNAVVTELLGLARERPEIFEDADRA